MKFSHETNYVFSGGLFLLTLLVAHVDHLGFIAMVSHLTLLYANLPEAA